MLDQTRELVARASEVYFSTPPAAAAVADLTVRLNEPLRVAIAGRVKAGKSTLLNALVGQRVAATDAGECTTLVTWYVHGPTRAAWATQAGVEIPVPMSVHDGRVELDVSAIDVATVERLTVAVPAPRLLDMTLIDTPGMASLSEAIAARSRRFLTAEDGLDSPADAVLYLMRHLHSTDVDFLDAFHEEGWGETTAVNALGVLSRSDEIGAGRADALDLAERVAAGYGADPRVRRLAQRVLPVAALLAQGAQDIGSADLDLLRSLADAPLADQDGALESADRFVQGLDSTPGGPRARWALLDRLGLFGVRLAVDLLRRSLVTDERSLSQALVSVSRVPDLSDALVQHFGWRADALKVRAVLRGLERVVDAHPGPATRSLSAEMERIRVNAHGLQEMATLDQIRAGEVLELDEGRRAELELLLGASGPERWRRLGLDADADAAQTRQAALAARSRWASEREQPLASAHVKRLAGIAIRTCEGIITETS